MTNLITIREHETKDKNEVIDLIRLIYEQQGFELFEIKKDYWAYGFDRYHMEYKRL